MPKYTRRELDNICDEQVLRKDGGTTKCDGCLGEADCHAEMVEFVVARRKAI
jgi:hypothetical protein